MLIMHLTVKLNGIVPFHGSTAMLPELSLQLNMIKHYPLILLLIIMAMTIILFIHGEAAIIF